MLGQWWRDAEKLYIYIYKFYIRRQIQTQDERWKMGCGRKHTGDPALILVSVVGHS